MNEWLSRWWRHMTSTEHHLSRRVGDPAQLRRIQRWRVVIAVMGGMAGGLGAGFCFSHAGLIGTKPENVLGLPALLITIVAVGVVVFPIPEIVRWVVVVTVALGSILLLDVSPAIKLAITIIGAAISYVIAVGIQFGIGMGRIAWGDLRRAFVLVVVGSGLGALTLTSTPSSAAAQGNDGLCPVGRLVVSIDGDESVFTPTGGKPFKLELESGEDRRLEVFARSDVSWGTVVVELVDIDPLPGLPTDRLIVWSGELEPSDDGGSTVADIVRVYPSDSGELMVDLASHDIETGLVVGQGRFRATLTDPETRGECHLDGLIRIMAPPLTTNPGRAGVVVCIIGLGLVGGSATAGSTPTMRRPGTMSDLGQDDDGSEATQQRSRAPHRPRVAIKSEQRREGRGLDKTTYFELVLRLTIEEDDEAIYQADVSNLQGLDLIKFGLAGSISGPGSNFELPIEVRTDPKKVEWDILALDLELTRTADSIASVQLFTLSHTGDRWSLEVLESDLDLREQTADAHKGAVSRADATSREGAS